MRRHAWRADGIFSPDLPELAAAATSVGEDIGLALDLAARVGSVLPRPGEGQTLARWRMLAQIGRASLTAARVVEAHSDALAILAEAGVAPTAGTWGVFAAEAPGQALVARPGRRGHVLHGRKPWCSLGGVLDRALVTARVEEGRQLFSVDLRQRGVHPAPADGWAARGLRTVTSVPIDFDGAAAEPVGEVGWYLRRAGFAWGGIGVAACWFGGAWGLADALDAAAVSRSDQLTALAVGEVDTALHAAAAVLAQAAEAIDAGHADAADGTLLALRARAVLADCVERVVRTVGHALGPAPLAFDPAYAARVADLELYVRQHHGERDLATLGQHLLEHDAHSDHA